MDIVESVRDFCISINDLRLEAYTTFEVEAEGLTDWTEGNMQPYVPKCITLLDKFTVLDASYFVIARALVNLIETVEDDEASAFYKKLLLKMDLLLLQTEQVLYYFSEGLCEFYEEEEGDVDGFY